MKKLLYVIIITIFLTACATLQKIVEVPVETIKTEYIYNTKIDSVFVKDSVDRIIKGDTVYIYKERIKEKYITITDTTIVIDSIPKIVQIKVVKEVNHLTQFLKILMCIGGAAIIALIVYIVLKIKK